MSKTEILNHIANNKSFKEMVYKQHYQPDLLDDLYQESFIIIADKTEKFLQDLFEADILLRYWNGIVYKSINSSTSPFFKKFRHTDNNISLSLQEENDSEDETNFDYNNILIDEQDPEIESDETKEKLLNKFDNQYWYDREIMKLYMTMRIEDIVKQVGISRHAVNMSLKRTRESLRDKANLNNKKNIW
jgi:hypothetical protein